MCLALPCRVVALGRDGTAVVTRAGASSTVSLLAAAAEISVGDWVLVHSGLILERLTDEDMRALAELALDGEDR